MHLNNMTADKMPSNTPIYFCNVSDWLHNIAHGWSVRKGDNKKFSSLPVENTTSEQKVLFSMKMSALGEKQWDTTENETDPFSEDSQ